MGKMGWNSKTDVIVLILLLVGGPVLIYPVIGLIVPTIVNIKRGDMRSLWVIPAIAVLMGSLIYYIRYRIRKSKKAKDEEKGIGED